MDRRDALRVALLIVVTAITRLLPHPPNFVPTGALALVSGSVLGGRWIAYGVPLAAMLAADLVLGLHGQMLVVYGCLAVVVWLGTRLGGRRGLIPVTAASVAGSTLFFVVTNLGVWAFDGLYPHSLEGLLACYVAALPFYGNSLIADLLYSWALFGLLDWLDRGISARRMQPASP